MKSLVSLLVFVVSVGGPGLGDFVLPTEREELGVPGVGEVRLFWYDKDDFPAASLVPGIVMGCGIRAMVTHVQVRYAGPKERVCLCAVEYERGLEVSRRILSEQIYGGMRMRSASDGTLEYISGPAFSSESQTFRVSCSAVRGLRGVTCFLSVVSFDTNEQDFYYSDEQLYESAVINAQDKNEYTISTLRGGELALRTNDGKKIFSAVERGVYSCVDSADVPMVTIRSGDRETKFVLGLK